MLMYIWLIVGRGQSLVLNQNQIITYYFFSVIIFRLTQSWTAETLSTQIKQGDFSVYLIKPVSFIFDRLAKDFALRTVRIISLLPFIAIVIFFFGSHLSLAFSPFHLSLTIAGLIVGYGISLLIEIIVALMAFYIIDTFGTFLILYLVKDLLSGSLIPLALMPGALKSISLLSPFYPQLGLPIDSLMGTLPPAKLVSQLIIALLWLISLTFLARAIYHQALKKYTAVGI
jgi:ABC-2 type transport system permease protein